MTEEQSFADLLEESYEEPVVLAPGEKVKATVVRISKEWVFIDLGGKSEGYFSVSEIRDKEETVDLKEGDSVEAYFLSAGKGGMKFTTRLGKGAEANEHLEEAFRAEIPVEGTIEKEVKGGFSVKIAGSVRAFCPFSQLGFPQTEGEDLSGRQLAFQIIEYHSFTSKDP
jgi:small subunit ribosomal protein S1